MGAKKFGMPLETREIKLFGRDITGFCWDILAAPEKFEKKKFVFNFWPLWKGLSEGASALWKVLRRQKHASSESMMNLAWTLDHLGFSI